MGVALDVVLCLGFPSVHTAIVRHWCEAGALGMHNLGSILGAKHLCLVCGNCRKPAAVMKSWGHCSYCIEPLSGHLPHNMQPAMFKVIGVGTVFGGPGAQPSLVAGGLIHFSVHHHHCCMHHSHFRATGVCFSRVGWSIIRELYSVTLLCASRLMPTAANIEESEGLGATVVSSVPEPEELPPDIKEGEPVEEVSDGDTNLESHEFRAGSAEKEGTIHM